MDAGAVSLAGARGLAQFMPATWVDIARELRIAGTPHDQVAIDAGAYYMSKLRRTWRRDRTALERNAMAQASYNAGVGNILKAQELCGGARLWPAVRECLRLATGHANAAETITYVARIEKWWRQMELSQ